VKGSGRVKRAISRTIGNSRKRQFCEFLSYRYLDWLDNWRAASVTEFELVTFVNSASFPDLILSISSYVQAAGRPLKWTLYADDEFSALQKTIIERLSFVEVKAWDQELTASSKLRYATKWQLRKFAAYGHHQLKGTTIYLDSDVLFYPVFRRYIDALRSGNWYLPEPAEANNIDLEMPKQFDFKRGMHTVNAGFLVINTPPDWSWGFQYLTHSVERGSDHYFLDQSALNLVYYHDKHARVLDPRVFHASADDHYSISALATDKLAIRHYVGLIRHKMWQLGWEQYFK
jgi:hypothetical protein